MQILTIRLNVTNHLRDTFRSVRYKSLPIKKSNVQTNISTNK